MATRSGEERTVGVIGLGQMGGAMAMHLVAAGFDVVGTDPLADRRVQVEDCGGRTVGSPAAVAAEADRIITSLPSEAALAAVVGGDEGLAGCGRQVTIIETSTLPLYAKQLAYDTLTAVGVDVLDCPLSGTGAQARDRDLVVYASGDATAIEACSTVFAAFSRAHHVVGAFGAGSKMKFLANLLVTIHNVAAAEAMVLGMKAGLDPERILEVISSGAGTSRMFEVRGPSMAADDYRTAGMAASVYLKDVRIIGDFAASLDCPVPLFRQSGEVHVAAVAQGHGDEDTASVCAVVERMAGLGRRPPASPAA